MSLPNSAKIRADLARGHLLLGELEPALACLERLAEESPDCEELEGLLRSFVEVCESGHPALLKTARQLYLRASAARVALEEAHGSAALEGERALEEAHGAATLEGERALEEAHAWAPLDPGDALEDEEQADAPAMADADVELEEAPLLDASEPELEIDAFGGSPDPTSTAHIARLEAWLESVRRHYASGGAYDLR